MFQAGVVSAAPAFACLLPSIGRRWRVSDGNWTVESTGSWSLRELAERQAAAGPPYLEFVRRPGLSFGLYVLAAGAVDGQSPHTEDEVYVVMEGRARLTMGNDEIPVEPGTVAFVAAGVDHRFHDIVERLVVLVAFGPAEGSRTEESPAAS